MARERGHVDTYSGAPTGEEKSEANPFRNSLRGAGSEKMIMGPKMVVAGDSESILRDPVPSCSNRECWFRHVRDCSNTECWFRRVRDAGEWCRDEGRGIFVQIGT